MRLTKLYALSLLLASTATVTIPSAGAQDRLFSNEAKQKAAALLEQMTLDEKVGQLIAGHIPTCGGYLYRRPLDALLGEHA
jgi:hypothetical protein